MPLKPFKPKKSFSKPQLIVYCLVFAAIGGYVILRSLAAGTSTANIWVDTTGGTCARSTSQVAYVDANACGDLTSAVAVASPGDTIGWKAGTYGNQLIANNPALRNLSPGCDPLGKFGAISTSNCVHIVPAAGETVTVNGNIETHASSIWIDGSVTNGVSTPQNFASRTFNITVNGYVDNEADSDTSYPDHNTFHGIDTLQIGAYNANHIVFQDVDAGPATKGTNCTVVESLGGSLAGNNVATAGGFTPEPSYVWFENVLFHDNTRDQNGAAADCHTGGFFAKGGDHVTFRSNVFVKNSVYNVQMQRVGSGPQPSDYTFENNWFDCPVDWPYISVSCIGQPDIQFNAADVFSNELIRYNSFINGVGCQVAGCSFSNSRFIGNLGSMPSNSVCGVSGTTWDYNAWVGTNGASQTTCSGTDVSISSSNDLASLFVNTSLSSPDLHLLNGTIAANNLVTPTTADYSLNTDIDGNTRTAPRDAGSDEFGGGGTTSPKPGDLNGDNTVNITDLSILLSNYNTSNAVADINKDGTVNILDLSILLSNYGT